MQTNLNAACPHSRLIQCFSCIEPTRQLGQTAESAQAFAFGQFDNAVIDGRRQAKIIGNQDNGTQRILHR